MEAGAAGPGLNLAVAASDLAVAGSDSTMAASDPAMVGVTSTSA